jgi:hypothetical protein
VEAFKIEKANPLPPSLKPANKKEVPTKYIGPINNGVCITLQPLFFASKSILFAISTFVHINKTAPLPN